MENSGILWEYTRAHANATYRPQFLWRHSEWSACGVSCGGGVQKATPMCVEVEAGLVEDR